MKELGYLGWDIWLEYLGEGVGISGVRELGYLG